MSCIFSSVDKGERKKNPRELYISWIGLRINKNKRHFHSCKVRSFIKSNTSVFHLLISQTSSQRHCQPFLEACGTSKRESKHNLRCIDLVISNSLAEHEVSGCDAEMQSLFLFFIWKYLDGHWWEKYVLSSVSGAWELLLWCTLAACIFS